MAGANDLGNGLGYIYMVDPNNGETRNVIRNDKRGVRWMRAAGAVNAPLWANRSAIATITVTGCASTGNITAITIGGVNQLSGNLAVATSTNSVLATAIAAATNAFTPASGYNYTASSSGAVVTVFAPASAGSAPNGLTISVSVSVGSITTTTTEFINGSGNQGSYDTSVGLMFWLDADYGASGVAGSTPASPGSRSFAIDVTKYLTVRGMEGSVDLQTINISLSGQLSPFDRRSNHTLVCVNAGAIPVLIGINASQFISGDIIRLSVDDGGNSFGVADARTVAGSNIYLSNEQPFTIGTSGEDFLTLMFTNEYAGLGAVFLEVARTGDQATIPNVVNQRAADVATPVQGVTNLVLTTGGGTANHTPGVSRQWHHYIGSGTLTSSWTIQTSTPVTDFLDGDELWTRYDGTFLAGGNNITIYGVPLTEDQIRKGGVVVMTKFSKDTGLWLTQTFLSQSLIGLGLLEVLPVPVSFESGKQCNNTVFIPYAFQPETVFATITKNFNNADDGAIDFSINGGSSLGILTIPASAVQDSVYSINLAGSIVYNNSSPNVVNMRTSKTTPGGEAIVTYTVKRRAS